MPEEALTSFTVSDAYSELLRSESRSRIEYVITTNNIIVHTLICLINLMSVTGFNTI